MMNLPRNVSYFKKKMEKSKNYEFMEGKRRTINLIDTNVCVELLLVPNVKLTFLSFSIKICFHFICTEEKIHRIH